VCLQHKNLGVGLRRPYRGQTYGGVLGAMARIPLRGLPHRVQRPDIRLYVLMKKMCLWLMGGRDHARSQTHEFSVWPMGEL
jgi:hypothetical protein